jgi:DNA-binding response OmpR family regulator
VIAIVSTNPRERVAFAALCGSQGWPTGEFDSVRGLELFLRQIAPKVVITRRRLSDGFSDDVIAALAAKPALAGCKVIALLERGASATEEARQISIGVDSIHRDPVRSDVLIAYLAKYHNAPAAPVRDGLTGIASHNFSFAGASVDTIKRRLTYRGKNRRVSPRQIQLMELLVEFEGEVVTYTTLYSEILSRRFSGETSNFRVLLQQLAITFQLLGISLRRFVEVIPKAGYRYANPSFRAAEREADALGRARTIPAGALRGGARRGTRR